MMLTAVQGHEEITKILIENGADINAINGVNATPLMGAVSGNALDIVKLFIRHNADLEIRSIEDKTTLAYAVTLGYYEVAKLLAENGANVNVEVQGVLSFDDSLCKRLEQYV